MTQTDSNLDADGRLSLREQRRRRQDELSMAHILDAAEEVFAAKGYVGATVREIAEQAEFSIGAIYNLFSGGKEEIFAAVSTRRAEEYLAMLTETLGSEGTPTARLHAVVDGVIDYYSEQATFTKLFQRAIGFDWLKFEAAAAEQNRLHYETILARYADLFQAGIDADEFRDDDAAAMAVLLVGIQTSYLAHTVVGLGATGTSMPDVYPRDKLHALVERAFIKH